MNRKMVCFALMIFIGAASAISEEVYMKDDLKDSNHLKSIRNDEEYEIGKIFNHLQITRTPRPPTITKPLGSYTVIHKHKNDHKEVDYSSQHGYIPVKVQSDTEYIIKQPNNHPHKRPIKEHGIDHYNNQQHSSEHINHGYSNNGYGNHGYNTHQYDNHGNNNQKYENHADGNHENNHHGYNNHAYESHGNNHGYNNHGNHNQSNGNNNHGHNNHEYDHHGNENHGYNHHGNNNHGYDSHGNNNYGHNNYGYNNHGNNIYENGYHDSHSYNGNDYFSSPHQVYHRPNQFSNHGIKPTPHDGDYPNHEPNLQNQYHNRPHELSYKPHYSQGHDHEPHYNHHEPYNLHGEPMSSHHQHQFRPHSPHDYHHDLNSYNHGHATHAGHVDDVDKPHNTFNGYEVHEIQDEHGYYKPHGHYAGHQPHYQHELYHTQHNYVPVNSHIHPPKYPTYKPHVTHKPVHIHAIYIGGSHLPNKNDHSDHGNELKPHASNANAHENKTRDEQKHREKEKMNNQSSIIQEKEDHQENSHIPETEIKYPEANSNVEAMVGSQSVPDKTSQEISSMTENSSTESSVIHESSTNSGGINQVEDTPLSNTEHHDTNGSESKPNTENPTNLNSNDQLTSSSQSISSSSEETQTSNTYSGTSTENYFDKPNLMVLVYNPGPIQTHDIKEPSVSSAHETQHIPGHEQISPSMTSLRPQTSNNNHYNHQSLHDVVEPQFQKPNPPNNVHLASHEVNTVHIPLFRPNGDSVEIKENITEASLGNAPVLGAPPVEYTLNKPHHSSEYGNGPHSENILYENYNFNHQSRPQYGQQFTDDSGEIYIQSHLQDGSHQSYYPQEQYDHRPHRQPTYEPLHNYNSLHQVTHNHGFTTGNKWDSFHDHKLDGYPTIHHGPYHHPHEPPHSNYLLHRRPVYNKNPHYTHRPLYSDYPPFRLSGIFINNYQKRYEDEKNYSKMSEDSPNHGFSEENHDEMDLFEQLLNSEDDEAFLRESKNFDTFYRGPSNPDIVGSTNHFLETGENLQIPYEMMHNFDDSHEHFGNSETAPLKNMIEILPSKIPKSVRNPPQKDNFHETDRASSYAGTPFAYVFTSSPNTGLSSLSPHHSYLLGEHLQQQSSSNGDHLHHGGQFNDHGDELHHNGHNKPNTHLNEVVGLQQISSPHHGDELHHNGHNKPNTHLNEVVGLQQISSPHHGDELHHNEHNKPNTHLNEVVGLQQISSPHHGDELHHNGHNKPNTHLNQVVGLQQISSPHQVLHNTGPHSFHESDHINLKPSDNHQHHNHQTNNTPVQYVYIPVLYGFPPHIQEHIKGMHSILHSNNHHSIVEGHRSNGLHSNQLNEITIFGIGRGNEGSSSTVRKPNSEALEPQNFIPTKVQMIIPQSKKEGFSLTWLFPGSSQLMYLDSSSDDDESVPRDEFEYLQRSGTDKLIEMRPKKYEASNVLGFQGIIKKYASKCEEIWNKILLAEESAGSMREGDITSTESAEPSKVSIEILQDLKRQSEFGSDKSASDDLQNNDDGKAQNSLNSICNEILKNLILSQVGALDNKIREKDTLPASDQGTIKFPNILSKSSPELETSELDESGLDKPAVIGNVDEANVRDGEQDEDDVTQDIHW